MAKTLQLLRNSAIFESRALALQGLKAKLVGAETPLKVAEPLVASYKETADPDSKIGILFAISMGDNANYQIFEGSKLTEGGELEIPQEVKDAIQDAIDGIIGGASEGYDTLGEIEALLKALQAELDATQVGTGLEANGSYTAKVDANYISGVSSLKGADEALDTALKAEETARTAKDTELEGELDALTATVEKNKVVAGQGIAVDTSGANTIVSAKIKPGDNALKVDGEGLFVDDSVLDTYVGSDAIAVSEAVEGEKTISLTIDPSDKVLSQSTAGLLSTLSLKYIKRVTTGDTAPAKLQLLGKGETIITELDVNDFVMDGMLANATLEGDELTFTFNTDAGSKEVTVDLSKYIDVYTAGNGIDITGKSVSVKLDGSTEGFLTVGTDGVKLSGVQTAIDQAEADAIATVKGTAVDYPTLGDVETKLDEVDTKLDDIDAYTVNGKAINTNPVLGGADIVISDYVRSEAENDELQLKVTDTVNDAFGKLEKAILDNEEVCSKAFDAVKAAVGLDVNLGYVAVAESNYISDATSVQDADSKLDAAIKAVDDKVAAEVGKEYLTSVVAGNGIEVSAKASNSQTITAKAVVSDPIIEVTSNGIGTKADANWDCGTY